MLIIPVAVPTISGGKSSCTLVRAIPPNPPQKMPKAEAPDREQGGGEHGMIRKQRRGEQDGDAAGGEEQDTLGPPDPRHDDPHQRRADHRAEGHAEKDAARRALVEAVALNEIRPGPEPPVMA